ncbi:IgM protease-like [Argopecten irradians]|uniref:IgM protease-like n=1 Tax=Argopecten irradians TaxID=31199 RepID=UPI0037115822
MVGDGSTDPVLLQVQRLLLKHEAQIEALQKENIRLAEKSLTLEGEVKFLQEKTVSLEEKIVTLEDKITSLEKDQPSADETEITRPCPEESNGIDGSRITRQPKDGVKKISKRVGTSLEQDQPSADETEITRPCPEESNGIDGSRITRQPKGTNRFLIYDKH